MSVSYRRSFACILLCLFCTAQAVIALAEDTGRFIKVERNDEGTVTELNSAVTSYICKDKNGYFHVDLIAAIHVGDKNYYHSLNRLFKNYDALLYELIAPQGYRPRLEDSSNSTVSSFQILITKLLGLSFQLQEIDYGLPNMVHADMSPEQFSKTMEERQESFLRMFVQLMVRSSIVKGGMGEEVPDLSSILMMFSEKGQYRARKRLLAAEFGKLESVASLIEDSGGTTILSARNAFVIEKVKEELNKGRRKLGIFYGAAHLPGIEAQIKDLYSAKESGIIWLTAWDMK